MPFYDPIGNEVGAYDHLIAKLLLDFKKLLNELHLHIGYLRV